MGSLIRATAMWGYPELVRELGGDPAAFLARFHIPAGAEHKEDAFVSFASLTRMLEASAEELRCPDFGLRLSGRQGLHILGPIAVIARNAQTVLGGVEAIAHYLYIHSPALRLAAGQRTEAGLEFTYEMTEPGVPYIQGYELSMGIAVRILRLLGGPQARISNGLLHASPAGLGRRLPRRAGLPGALRAGVVRVRAAVAAGRPAHRERGPGDPAHRHQIP